MGDATQDYLDMSKDVTNCQNKASFEVCETEKYFEIVQEKCNCIPVKIGSSYKEPLCDNDSAGRECAAKVPKSLGTPCIAPCKGLYADVKKTPYIDKRFSSDA